MEPHWLQDLFWLPKSPSQKNLRASDCMHFAHNENTWFAFNLYVMCVYQYSNYMCYGV